MTDNTLQNAADTDRSAAENSALIAEEGAGTSRRDVMVTLAKHAAYTAPAVLAILSLTTKRARAFSF